MTKREREEYIKLHIYDQSYKEMAKACGCHIATIGNTITELKLTKSQIAIDKEDEIWIDLSYLDYNGYWISNYGRIKNKDNIIIKEQKLEYPRVRLTNSKTNKRDSWYIHKLVATVFLYNDDPVNKIQVNHKDGNKENYNINNLEWVTPSENQKHAYKTGLRKAVKGTESCRSIHTEEDVKIVCELLQNGKTILQIMNLYPNYTKYWLRNIKNHRIWKHISCNYNF